MGSGRDNKAGKGKSGTSKDLNPPTTMQRTPTPGSTLPTTTPAITHGNSTADGASAKTAVSNNASNVQATPRIPVKRPHEGPMIPNASRTKVSDQAAADKSRTPSKFDGRSVDRPQSVKSEQAKDDESDEIESLFAAYRPVDGIGAARPSSSNPLPRGPNSVGLGMTSTATTTSNIATEASERIPTTFNTIGMPDTAAGANKAITSIEAPTSLFAGPSATTATPNTTSTPPKSFLTKPDSSQTRSVPLFALGRPKQKPNISSAFNPPIDFGTAPTPNPATTSRLNVPNMLEAASKPDPALASQFSVLNMLDTAPTSNPTKESPFGGLKMADTAITPNLVTDSPFAKFKLSGIAPKTNLAIESPFGELKMAGTATASNLATHSSFSSSKAPATTSVPNPAAMSPFGLFKLPPTAPGPNPAIKSPFGIFETAPSPNPATTSPFGKFTIAPTPNVATNSPFGKVKTPGEGIFGKSNFPTSDSGDSQAKWFFGNLSEQARQSKSNCIGFGSTGSSPYPFTTTQPTGFYPGNGSSSEIYNPAIFNESELPPIRPEFNPKMASTEGLSNMDQPMDACGHYQPGNHSLSSPFKLLQNDDALPTANITGSLTTQHLGNQFGSPFTQTTNEITVQKTENLIASQKYAIQELRSSMAWLSKQNEIVSRNLAISTENLGLCGAQLQYFSKHCNDLKETCKEYREAGVKLQEELNKVNVTREAENKNINLVLESLKKKKYASPSKFVICIHILVYVVVALLIISIHKIF